MINNFEHPAFNVKDWQIVDNEEIYEKLLKRGLSTKGKKRGIWQNDGSLSPLEFYCYLKVRFGDPNGYMMLLKSPTVDNLIHWHFIIKARNIFIDIIGMNYRTEFHIDNADNFNEKDWKKIVFEIIKDYKNYPKEITKVIKSLEKWYIFINPFFRIEKIIDDYTKKLIKLNIENIHEFQR